LYQKLSGKSGAFVSGAIKEKKKSARGVEEISRGGIQGVRRREEMGRNNRGRGNRRGGGGGRGGGGRGGGGRHGERQDYQKWPEIQKDSAQMRAYYEAQNIFGEEEWPAFLAAARANLPTTFRISPVVTFAEQMKKKIRSHFEDLKIDEIAKDMQEEDERLQPPHPIPWYPDELAWGMTISKKALKKTPALEKFHKYLVAETETGNITRQEAVSMIPPLFMDVEPHHRVLDMCAAPGSKTSQCLEFLHAKCGATGVPTGVVIANDADLDRCSMLTHQMKRINSPSLIVLHHEAQCIPMLWQKEGEGAAQKRTPMRYDRILCDVPCSGDGTMRKNVDVWKKWSPAQGLGLHRTQLMILSRAVELCEIGGIVVYSTCSMNPIENESVVAAALVKYRHCLELEDTSSVCPALIRRAGLHTWKVRDRKDESKWYTLEDVPGNLKTIYPASCFPPADAAGLHLPGYHEGNGLSVAVLHGVHGVVCFVVLCAAVLVAHATRLATSDTLALLPPPALHLERCVRIYPHDQDTGGFFICKLRKTADHMPKKAGARLNLPSLPRPLSLGA
jgi:16S rRNA C967 or C1407 C5-methylase (RsmB/RsmF family)